MKKQMLKSMLMAVVGVGMMVGSALALPTIPDGSWANLQGFLGLSYFPGVETSTPTLDFTERWRYTAIGKESGNVNDIDQAITAGVGTTNNGLTFTTANLSNWGNWEIVDFTATNLFFEDSNGPFNIALDPFTTISDPGFKIFRLTQDSEILGYLANPLKLKAGDYIIGFNDNSLQDTDSDYDDIIIAMRPIPEPATMLLFGTGIAGLAGIARRKKTTKA